MTKVKINDKPDRRIMKIKDIMAGDLFRYKDNIYLMTDEIDSDGDALALLITDASNFGVLIPFVDIEEVVKLNGTIFVEIN